MDVSEEQAKHALFAIHDAWNAGDVERVLSFYVDDLTYWVNMGGPGGGPLTILGKDQFRLRLKGWDGLESLSVPNQFRFKAGIVRANVEFSVRNPQTGQGFSSSYRQALMFRGEKISRMEQHHDAPAASVFMSLMKKE
jgi:ketosteroid isomerase-like protein